jgi:short-subunit dehydrogenase
MNATKALLIGNSDGIGAATTRKLLERGFHVVGISKSEFKIDHPRYRHIICDVCSEEYRKRLREESQIDLCIYFAGIGDAIDWNDLSRETKTGMSP